MQIGGAEDWHRIRAPLNVELQRPLGRLKLDLSAGHINETALIAGTPGVGWMSLECADSDQLAADENRTKRTRIYREGVGIWHKRARKAGRGKRLGVRGSYIEERAAPAEREGKAQDPEIEFDDARCARTSEVFANIATVMSSVHSPPWKGQCARELRVVAEKRRLIFRQHVRRRGRFACIRLSS